MSVKIKLKRLSHGSALPLPQQMTAGSSGFDIHAAVETDFVLAPGCFHAVPTGFCYEIPAGCEVQIRPRSGLAFKNGVTVLNAPGTIDSDYRGEVKIILINHSTAPFIIRRGDRIAQAVVATLCSVVLVEDSQLNETTRSSGGFGHTGQSSQES